MGVDVRHGVVEGRVVELAGLVGLLDGLGGGADVGPVAGELGVGEVAGVGHVPAAEDGEGRAWLGQLALEVGVGPAAGEEADAPGVLAGAALGASGAVLAGAPGLPVGRPGPWYACSMAPSGCGPCPSRCAGSSTKVFMVRGEPRIPKEATGSVGEVMGSMAMVEPNHQSGGYRGG